MPHVKGNKFKPAPTEKELKRQRDEEDVGAAAAAEAPPPAKKKKKKRTSQKDGAAVVTIATVVAPAPKGKATSISATSANWDALKATMQHRPGRKRKAPERGAAAAAVKVTKTLAIDCEMVGAGKRGERSLLARVSVVNSAGGVVLDSFVDPGEKVTDYRTKWSGIRPHDLRGAPPFAEVQARVAALLKGRLVVGHALLNDLQALGLDHPADSLRDTSKYPPLMRTLPGGRTKPQALKLLAQEHLELGIQAAEHCSLEDARAALALYRKHKKEWERWLAAGGATTRGPAAAAPHRGVNKSKDGAPMGTQMLAELARSDYMADL